MNLAKMAYCPKYEGLDSAVFYIGLGLVDITIEPLRLNG